MGKKIYKGDVAGVIPARWGSQRFPGKPIVPIAGKPLLQWVWEGASQSALLDTLVVATDDERIAQTVESFGGRAVMTRPDHPSGSDRVAEAVNALGDVEIVVNIQGDEPFIDPGLIDRLVEAMRKTGMDMATARAPITDVQDVNQPSVVKVVCDRNHKALYFSRSPIPYLREKSVEPGGDAPYYWRHIGIYAYTSRFLRELVQEPPCQLEQLEKLEQLRALDLGAGIYVVDTDEVSLGVDEPGDVQKAERALSKAGKI